MMKSWTTLNINEFTLFDRFGSPCRRLQILVKFTGSLSMVLSLSLPQTHTPPSLHTFWDVIFLGSVFRWLETRACISRGNPAAN